MSDVKLRYKWPEIPIGEEANIRDPWFVVYAPDDASVWTAYRARYQAEQHATRTGVGFIVMAARLPESPGLGPRTSHGT